MKIKTNLNLKHSFIIVNLAKENVLSEELKVRKLNLAKDA
jgi:hypothetical protein